MIPVSRCAKVKSYSRQNCVLRITLKLYHKSRSNFTKFRASFAFIVFFHCLLRSAEKEDGIVSKVATRTLELFRNPRYSCVIKAVALERVRVQLNDFAKVE